MNRRRCRKRWLSLWLVAAVLGHFGLHAREASAFVLCFGSDGHVAVERPGHDHRSEPGRASKGAPSEAGVYALQSGATPCVDVPVVSEDHGAHKPLNGSRAATLDLAPSALAAVLIALIPIGELVIAPLFFPDPPSVDPGRSALRSVILLI